MLNAAIKKSLDFLTAALQLMLLSQKHDAGSGLGCKKGKAGKFSEATRRVTAGNLPVLHFCKPPQDKSGLFDSCIT